MKDLFNARYVLQRNRYAWIDYAKGVCIILVCYRHSFEGLINAGFPTNDYPLLSLVNSSLVTFRMALFFIISGCFIGPTLAKKGFNNYAIDRFKVIIYPLLIWGSIQITLQLIFGNYTNVKRTGFDYLNLLIMPRKIEQFWYLNTLFMVGVLYAFLKSVLRFKSWQLMASAVLLYGIGAIYYSTNFNMRYELLSYSFIPDLLHYYIFFFIGDMISSFLLNKENTEKIVALKLLIPVFIIFLITHYFYTVVNEEQHRSYYVEFYMPLSYLIIALSGCALTIQLSFLLQKYNRLKFLRVIGYHSLYIYLMHVIFTGSIRVVIAKIFHIYNIPLLLLVSVVSGILFPVIIYNFLVRNGMWWLYSLKKPNDEINHSKMILI